jgi:hypothetical protein
VYLRQALQWLRDDIKPIHPAFEPLLRKAELFQGDYTKEKHLLYAAIRTRQIRLFGCPGTGQIFQDWEGSMKWGFGDHGERQLIPVSKLDEADFEDLDFKRGWLGIGFCNSRGHVKDGWAYDDLIIATSELMRVFPPCDDPFPTPIELNISESEVLSAAVMPDATPRREKEVVEPLMENDDSNNNAASVSLPRGFQTNKEARAEEAAVNWLRQQSQAARLTKSEAFEAAKLAVAEIGPLSQTAFFDRVWPLNVPKQWKQPGRPHARKS